MNKRILVVGAIVVLAAAGVAAATGRPWGRIAELWSGGANAQAPRQGGQRAVPVEVAIAEKKTVPVRVQALGTVTPIASVAVKPRIDSEIVGVHFRDGATVNVGDLLFTLDSRAIE